MGAILIFVHTSSHSGNQLRFIEAGRSKSRSTLSEERHLKSDSCNASPVFKFILEVPPAITSDLTKCFSRLRCFQKPVHASIAPSEQSACRTSRATRCAPICTFDYTNTFTGLITPNYSRHRVLYCPFYHAILVCTALGQLVSQVCKSKDSHAPPS